MCKIEVLYNKFQITKALLCQVVDQVLYLSQERGRLLPTQVLQDAIAEATQKAWSGAYDDDPSIVIPADFAPVARGILIASIERHDK